MDLYGARFPILPNLRTKLVEEENQMDIDTASTLWTTMALLSRIQTIWDIISNVNLCSSQWEGWILNSLSRQCFSNLSSTMNKTDPFKTSLTTKAIHLYNTFDESNENMSDLKVVFGKVDDSFLIVDMERDEQNFFYRIKDSHKIIVFKGYDELYNLDNGRGLKRTFNNFDYELRFISATWKFDTRVGGMSKSKWDGFVYSRHGGSQHKNWWYYGRNDRMAIHYDTDFNFYSQEKVIIAYVRCEQIQIDRYRRDFNHYIGGKTISFVIHTNVL